MGIKHGRGWGGARISLSRGSVLSREYFPSSFVMYFTISAEIMQIFQNAKKLWMQTYSLYNLWFYLFSLTMMHVLGRCGLYNQSAPGSSLFLGTWGRDWAQSHWSWRAVWSQVECSWRPGRGEWCCGRWGAPCPWLPGASAPSLQPSASHCNTGVVQVDR